MVPLTVHWDGKLLEGLTTHEHAERLPVLISGVGVEVTGQSKTILRNRISPSICSHPAFERVEYSV